MFEVVLHQPEIAPNTGNIIRLCANAGARLHLIEPLGFSLAERAVRRAGMDYAELAEVRRHASWQSLVEALPGARFFAITTSGSTRHDAPRFTPGDVFVFGSETRGLPQAVHEAIAPERRLRIPMQPASRSMNLSNSVAVVLFEAWRQGGFAGGR
jgi:tRNA (cytidine/uridine-2'-O-)-methyltransferase